MLLLVYFAGSALQAWDLYIGLALTLWGVILVPTLLYPRWVRLPARELLGLRRTRWVNYVYGFLIAVSSVLLISAYMRVQSEYLPFPSAMEEFFRELLGKDDLTPVLRLLLFAVSPAICEELLWRGAFQGEVGVRGRTLATVTVVGVFFGFFHLSIYRAIPTGVLGAVLALVRIRSGSIFPCILVHAVYNGVAVQYIDRLVEDEDLAAVLLGPGALAIAGAVLVGSLWGLRSRQESAERRTPSSGH
jgi:membrane protease YdiL (CAAX protease family)